VIGGGRRAPERGSGVGDPGRPGSAKPEGIDGCARWAGRLNTHLAQMGTGNGDLQRWPSGRRKTARMRDPTSRKHRPKYCALARSRAGQGVRSSASTIRT
jgi:hypothetical protein